MASTRSKNSPGDYELEIKGKILQADYRTYEPFGAPTQTTWAGDGLLFGTVGPSKLSSNYCDIESNLRGIGANNLIAPLPDLAPQINQLQSLNIIDRPKVQLPEPFSQNTLERPFRGQR
jgi:hypothetical protein